MKRAVGLTLLGVGAFLLVLAPLLRWYAYPSLAVVPLDQDRQTVSVGPDATVLDTSTLSEQQTDLTSTRVVVGDVEASEEAGDDIAIWDTRLTTENAQGTIINAYTERVAFDRYTGEAVNGYDENYNDEPAEHSGLVFKFPFGTEQKTYDFWDSTIQQPRPAEFAGEEEIEGLAVYKFVQEIAPTPYAAPNATIQVPGSLVDAPEPSVEADRLYSNTRTLWVEPETGVIIKGQEEQRNTLNYEGEDKVITTEVTIAYDDETVQSLVDDYAPDARSLKLLRTTVPLVALVLGALALVVGLVLLLSPSRQPGHRAGGDTSKADRETVPGDAPRKDDTSIELMRPDDGR